MIHSQWQIWRYPNLSEQSLHRGNLESCATSWFVCFSTPSDVCKTKISQALYFHFFFLLSNPTKQHHSTLQCNFSGTARNCFFYSDFKAKRLNSGSENWIEICHLLQVRTETSIEANQFYTVYTMGWFFLDINFFFPPSDTHYKPPHQTNTQPRDCFANTFGDDSSSSKNVQLYNRLQTTAYPMLAFKC